MSSASKSSSSTARERRRRQRASRQQLSQKLASSTLASLASEATASASTASTSTPSQDKDGTSTSSARTGPEAAAWAALDASALGLYRLLMDGIAKSDPTNFAQWWGAADAVLQQALPDAPLAWVYIHLYAVPTDEAGAQAWKSGASVGNRMCSSIGSNTNWWIDWLPRQPDAFFLRLLTAAKQSVLGTDNVIVIDNQQPETHPLKLVVVSVSKIEAMQQDLGPLPTVLRCAKQKRHENFQLIYVTIERVSATDARVGHHVLPCTVPWCADVQAFRRLWLIALRGHKNLFSSAF